MKCRINGQACEHHISNYSSEIEDAFVAESIASADSNIDLQQILEAVQNMKPQFGKSREAQAEHRRKAFEDLQQKAHRGKVGIGNAYLRNQLIRGPEKTERLAEYTYSMPPGTRIPTPEEHFVQNQIPHEPLPIYRPSVMLNMKYDDLTDDEYLALLELYRSPMLSKRAITDG